MGSLRLSSCRGFKETRTMAQRLTAKTEMVEVWVRSYSKPLFAYAATRMNSQTDAEDVVQETFLKAYRSQASFTPGSDAKSWLFQILINTIRDHYRKAATRANHLAMEDVDETEIELSAVSQGPDVAAEQEEQSEMLAAALRDLPEQLAAPLMLREIADQSYKEIASALEIPIGTVMSRLSRARKLLAKILAPRLQIEGELKSQAGALMQTGPQNLSDVDANKSDLESDTDRMIEK